MTKKRFEIVESELVKDGWVISDKLKQFTFPTLRGDKRALVSYCKALNELVKENMMLKDKNTYYKILLMSLEETAKKFCEVPRVKNDKER